MRINQRHNASSYPKVLLVYTGGTIGMVENPVTHAHEPLDFSNIADNLPEMRQITVNLHTVQFSEPVDSSDMNPELWTRLAQIIIDAYDDYDGFVVLHGTDTMAYTASALSYMLQGLRKAVVLTGSQLPIGVLRTDGKENLITAIEIAASYDRIGQPMVPEVSIYFQGLLLRGNRAKKLSSEEFHAFSSPNYPPLARVGVHITWAHHHIMHPAYDSELAPKLSMCSDVLSVRVVPGLKRELFHGILALPSLRGLVIETYGAGNAMTAKWFLDELRLAVNRGVVIVNVTQCIGGKVEMDIYKTGTGLAAAGVISSGDMTTEATIVKLMHLLGQGYSQSEVERRMQIPISGEMV